MKTKTQFFVMLRTQRGSVIPLMEGHNPNHPLALFDSEKEAERAALANILGEAHGYEVYPVEVLDQ